MSDYENSPYNAANGGALAMKANREFRQALNPSDDSDPIDSITFGELEMAAKEIKRLRGERDALLGLIRFALAPHVHPDMIEAMIRDALAGGRGDE
jgi:hypothetical protein